MAARNPKQSSSNNSRMALVNQDNSSSNGHLGEVYEASGGTPLMPRDEIVSENTAQRGSRGDYSNLHKSENPEDLSSTEVAVLEDSQMARSVNPVKEAGKSSRNVVNEWDSNSSSNKLNVALVERDDAGKIPEVNTTCEHPSSSQSNDVYKINFSQTDTLRTVKELIDSKELGLSGRQALIVVPHQRGNVSSRGDFPSSYQRNTVDGSSDCDSGGHYGILKRIFSYVNPFSYVGYFRTSSGTTESEDGGSGYGPKHTLQSGGATLGSASRFGSNIYTLKHDEDDDRFGDRNAVWNGNSTQYGGNSNSNSK